MKILTLDIETAPNLGHVWSLWKQNISLSQLMESGYVMCFAYKWYGKKGTKFVRGDDIPFEAHEVLSEADAVITYNGISFDIPYLNAAILDKRLSPPDPFKNIDLLPTVRKRFRFPSNKLDYVAQRLGLGGKAKHEGHDLWVKCMAGDEAAWKRMEKYNRRDVVLTEQVYDIILPWITNHPNHALYMDTEKPVCVACGSERLHRKGFETTLVGRYQRFKCLHCGHPNRGRYQDLSPEQRKNVLRSVV